MANNSFTFHDEVMNCYTVTETLIFNFILHTNLASSLFPRYDIFSDLAGKTVMIWTQHKRQWTQCFINCVNSQLFIKIDFKTKL